MKKNLGLQQLVLNGNPQCEPLSVEAQQMAVRRYPRRICPAGGDVAASFARVYSCARHNCSCSWLTTQLEKPAALPRLLGPPGKAAALIFGPEYRVQAMRELNYALSHSLWSCLSASYLLAQRWQFMITNFLQSTQLQPSANSYATAGRHAR